MSSIFILQAFVNDFERIVKLDLAKFFSKELLERIATFSKLRQKQYLLNRFLLRELLIEHDFLAKNEPLPEIIYTQNKRPYFKAFEFPNFNITHSEDKIAVGISLNSNIGLDLEMKRERKAFLKIAQQFFSNSEYIWLHKQTDPLAAFWQLWTLRESALKLYSKGVWQMKQIEIKMPEMQILASFGDSFYPEIRIDNNMFLTICSDKPIQGLQINQF